MATTRHRYSQSSKKNTRNILDEFTAITGHRRKDSIRLLGSTADNICCRNPVFTTVASQRKRRRYLQSGRHIPVRTFADWNQPPIGVSGNRPGDALRENHGRFVHLQPGDEASLQIIWPTLRAKLRCRTTMERWKYHSPRVPPNAAFSVTFLNEETENRQECLTRDACPANAHIPLSKDRKQAKTVIASSCHVMLG